MENGGEYETRSSYLEGIFLPSFMRQFIVKYSYYLSEMLSTCPRLETREWPLVGNDDPALI